MEAEGKAAEYPEQEQVQFPIFYADGFEHEIQQSSHDHGQHTFFEKILYDFGFCHGKHLHSYCKYIRYNSMRPGAGGKTGKSA